MKIKTLNSTDTDFYQTLSGKLQTDDITDDNLIPYVNEIINNVKKNGDSALIDYCLKFDNLKIDKKENLEIQHQELQNAWNKISGEQQQALETAKDRIEKYAKKQKLKSWQYDESDGSKLGQKITAIESIGLYVPGGKAAYPSSVLMNAIPAKVAGVGELIMVVPTPNNERNNLVLAAAFLCQVDRVFCVGGAQAIAALSYGTDTIPKVDKIVGPGNIYVATAKKLLFGTVGIDMIAGPSEILIISDGTTNPDWIAMDLFSQAEHDEKAQSILICPEDNYMAKVKQSIDKLIKTMPRAQIIKKSLNDRGLFIKCQNLDDACKIANFVAAEHLEISTKNPAELVDKIQNAGAIFMGSYSAEVFGDYVAGPNHVLPTSGTARFSSALGVYDFQKRTSIINLSKTGAKKLSTTAITLAEGEGLAAHAESARYRLK
ncbi:MAG: histidinol dehydrogenase [Gammaproteobacteria bacterium]|nr:MAG: histidinol dehydrogenase [Gammaproteobacteria bacterium]